MSVLAESYQNITARQAVGAYPHAVMQSKPIPRAIRKELRESPYRTLTLDELRAIAMQSAYLYSQEFGQNPAAAANYAYMKDFRDGGDFSVGVMPALEPLPELDDSEDPSHSARERLLERYDAIMQQLMQLNQYELAHAKQLSIMSGAVTADMSARGLIVREQQVEVADGINTAVHRHITCARPEQDPVQVRAALRDDLRNTIAPRFTGTTEQLDHELDQIMSEAEAHIAQRRQLMEARSRLEGQLDGVLRALNSPASAATVAATVAPPPTAPQAPTPAANSAVDPAVVAAYTAPPPAYDGPPAYNSLYPDSPPAYGSAVDDDDKTDGFTPKPTKS